MAVNIMLVPSVDYNLSKSEMLRAVVADKLTSASQEILAVVQWTVAGFEDEISALRSEITRQRHQLELLQPRITLCRPVSEEAVRVEAGGGEAPKEEEQIVSEEAVRVEAGGGEAPKEEEQIDVEDLDSFEEDEDEKDEEEPVLHQGDPQTPEHSDSVRKRRKAGRKRSDFVKLRVCFLHDADTDTLRKGLLKSGVRELRCPPGLSEDDFLLLLRSSFPRLRLPLDAMTADSSRHLQKLELKSLTPEEIQRSVGAVGRGRSALYLRERRSADNSQDSEQLPVPGRKDDVTHETGSDENRPKTSSHYSPAENMQSDEADKPTQQQETDVDGEKPGRSEAEEGGDGEDDDEGEEDDGEDGDEGEEDVGDKEWKPVEEPEESDDGEKELRGEASGVKTKRRKETVSAPLACKVCGALRGSPNMLIKHSWDHVHEQESVCGVCGENVEDLRHHLQTHQKTLASCDTCGKSFLTAASRDKHAVLHTGEKPYECDICHKAYALKSSLNGHRREHVQENPHKCQVCDRSFASSRQLRVHSSSHTGEKPYSCDVCRKSLCDLRSLSRHKLTHSGEKRHVCQVCGKRFLLPEKLKTHKKIHVARDKTHLCDVCCKTFHTFSQLKGHLKTHSGDKIICQECGKGLSSQGALIRHMVIHTGEKPHKCSECGRTFNALSILRGHMKTHSGVKPFVCKICGKVCARKEHLTVHMRLHNGEKPYKCIVCEKAFTQSHCLKTHMKNHRRDEETVT